MDRYVVIMAGGIGSRFWPSSTEEKPKQFLDITGTGKSLIRMTYERCLPFIKNENILVVTNKMYQPLVKNELTELPAENILCEPSRNNTAPCIAYAALHINARSKESSFAVLASDHIILNETAFLVSLQKVFDYAEANDALMTLSITPSRPDTGYGYIELSEDVSEIKKVKSFKEKPALEVAIQYLFSGRYAWNSGMFVWKTSSIIEAFKQHCPDIIDILNQQPHKYNSITEQDYIDEVYPGTQEISIDYAIIEKADNVYTLPSEFGWSDLGTWASLYDFSDKDENKNVQISGEKILLNETTGCLIKSKSNKKILIRGLENFIVVDEDDALLIYPVNKEQEIKADQKKLNSI